MLGLSATGLTLIGLALVIPVQPVTTCLTNSYGTFCTVHTLDGTRVVHCGYNVAYPNEPRSCMQTSILNPLPLLYFWPVDIGMAGFILLVVGAFYALRILRVGGLCVLASLTL